jgi:hypothetical protein
LGKTSQNVVKSFVDLTKGNKEAMLHTGLDIINKLLSQNNQRRG